MENSSEKKPENSVYWLRALESAEKISAEKKLKAAEIRRGLTLEIFNRISGESPLKGDWDLCMPLPYRLCHEIVQTAMKLDRKRIKAKFFSSYEMNQAEEDLVDMLISYGQALGVEDIVHEIRRQALDFGCTKSQKMYLDYIAGIDLDGDEDSSVHLNITLAGDDDSAKKKEKVINPVG